MDIIVRVNRRDYREGITASGDLVIARAIAPSMWLVTAHSANLMGEAQGVVYKELAGFRGRQWESDIDGQQHASLTEAMRAALDTARFRAKVAGLTDWTGTADYSAMVRKGLDV